MFDSFDIEANGLIDYNEFSTAFFGSDSAEKYQDHYLREKAKREAHAAKIRGDDPHTLLNLFKEKIKGRGPRGMIAL